MRKVCLKLTIQDPWYLWYPTQGVDPAHAVWVPDYIGDTTVVNWRVCRIF